MLVTFNNWNIINFTNKTTSSEDLDDIHNVVLDDIRDNMASLMQPGKYGAINTDDPKTVGY